MSSESTDINKLSESYIQDAFHSYVKSSLTQAKAERLLDADVLSSSAGDVMITGPALCLYFAALRCTTNPPSVPLPRHSKSAHSQPMDLSIDNCPPAFASFLRVWANTVPSIQSLTPEHQHDLARIICGLEPVSQPSEPSLGGIAADLRAVAIEISQRRSFQDRYASDLQAALDSGDSRGLKVKASFVPPPMYEEATSPASSPSHSPRPSVNTLPPSPPRHREQPPEPALLSPNGPLSRTHSRNNSHSSVSSHNSSASSSGSIFDNSPAIDMIRETLYAALGDELATHPSIRSLIATDSSRAYFASVAFAILSVSTTSITPSGSVRGVLGQELTLQECPRDLKPFMMELGAIGHQAQELGELDDQMAMDAAARGATIPEDKMYLPRVHKILEGGVGHDEHRGREDSRRRSIEGRAVAFANRINALALGMTRIKAFRDRQADIFKVLAGVS